MNIKIAVMAAGLTVSTLASAFDHDEAIAEASPLVIDGLAQLNKQDESGLGDVRRSVLFLELATITQRVYFEPAAARDEMQYLLQLTGEARARYEPSEQSLAPEPVEAHIQSQGTDAFLSCASALGAVASAEDAAVLTCANGAAPTCAASLDALGAATLSAVLICEGNPRPNR